MKRLTTLIVMMIGLCLPAMAYADAPAPEHKTATDIADKALDMFSSSVATVSATMQKVAPEMWRIMIRQQYSEAVSEVLVGVLSLLLVIGATVFIRKAVKQKWADFDEADDHREEGTFIFKEIARNYLPLLFMIIFGGCLIADISDATQRLINPEYYAIKDLAAMVIPQPKKQ